MKLSLNMIVKNESELLPRALKSVADCVDEMIIVDTGSTDNTKEIAASFGAKVYDFTWIDNFSEARNEAIKHSTGDYIFTLDADEFLSPFYRQLFLKFREQLDSKDKGYYFLKALMVKGTIFKYVPRLFIFPNRSDVRWQYRAHEQVNLNFKTLGITYDELNIEVYAERDNVDDKVIDKKSEYYCRLLHEDLLEHPHASSVLYHLGREYYFLHKYPEAVQYLNSALDYIPEDSLILEDLSFYLACSLYFSGRMVEGWSALKNAREVYPHSLPLSHFEASLYRAQAQYDKAEQLFKEIIEFTEKADHTALKTTPENARMIAHTALGDLYFTQKRFAEAEQMWRLVLKDFPQNSKALEGLKKIRTE